MLSVAPLKLELWRPAIWRERVFHAVLSVAPLKPYGLLSSTPFASLPRCAQRGPIEAPVTAGNLIVVPVFHAVLSVAPLKLDRASHGRY